MYNAKQRLTNPLTTHRRKPLLRLAQWAAILFVLSVSGALSSSVHSAVVGGCGADGGEPNPCEGAADPGSTAQTGTPNVGGGNPIHLITGNKYQREIDHQPYMGTTATKLVFMRHYNSANTDNDFGLGPGWSMSYDTRIGQLSEQQLQIVQSDGRRIVFTRKSNPETNESKYQAVNPTDGTIYQNDHHYRWYLRDGRALYFNLDGQLTRIHHQTRNITLTMYRNTRGWLTQVRDDAERRIQLQYYDKKDAQQTNGINVTDRLHGKLRRITIPTGETIHYHYDQAGNLRQVTYPNQTTRSYHYEDVNHPHALTGITNEKNTRTVTWGYDQEGRANLSEQAAQVGRVTLDYQLPLHANELGRTLVTNSLGQQATYTWRRDALQAQALLLRGEGIACSSCPKTGVQYQYNENYQLSEATFQDYLSIRYRYDNLGRLSSLTQQAEDTPEQMIERFEYLGETNLKTAIHRPSVKPNANKTITYVYNEKEQPVQISENGYRPTTEGDYVAITKTTQLRYQDQDLVAIDGPRENVEDIVKLQYDDHRRLTQLTTPDQRTLRVLHYDEYGRPTQLQQQQQTPIEITYNETGLPKHIRQGLNSVDYRYDATGSLTQIETSDGKKIEVTYDAAGRAQQLTDGEGRQLNLELDTEGKHIHRTLSTQGQQWQTLSYLYDAQNRLQSIQDQQGNQLAEYGYDDNDRITSITDRNQNQTQLDYGPFGQLLAVTQPGNVTTRYHYNQQSQQLTGLTDARNNKTEYLQDDFGNVVQQTSADTGTTNYQYDAAGNLIQKTDAAGNLTKNHYDAANRLVQRQTEEGPNIHKTTLSYDSNSGRLAVIKTNATTETFAYNEAGNLIAHTREIDDHSFITKYAYNERQQLIKKYLPDGQTLRYHYHQKGENKNKLRAITRGNLIGRTTIIGELNSSDTPTHKHVVHGNGIVTDYTYALDGKLLAIENTQVPSFNYTYDERGNITGINQDSYQYNVLGQLTYAHVRNHEYWYEYDAIGNRIQKIKNDETTTYTYRSEGQGNALTTVTNESENTEQHYQYNPAGSPEAVTSSNQKLDEKRYVYNSQQRPVQYYENNQLKAEYTYNTFGERIKKVVYSQNQKQVTYYLYDGHTLTAEANAQGSITAQYIYYKEHQPIAKLEKKTIYAIHSDHLGTPRSVTDKHKNIIWQASYSPFGEAEITQPTYHRSFVLNLRFPGQYFDQESSQHYNYLRDYDPQTGRYLTSDPIGLKGGLNTFAYVDGNPLSGMDPLGLQTVAGDVGFNTTTGPFGFPKKPTARDYVLSLTPGGLIFVNEHSREAAFEFGKALGEDIIGLGQLILDGAVLTADTSILGQATDIIFGNDVPWWLPSNRRGQQTLDDLRALLELLREDPWLVWEALKGPYVELLDDCEYARVFGRGTYDSLSLVIGLGWLAKLGKAGKLSQILARVKAKKTAGGIVAAKTTKLGAETFYRAMSRADYEEFLRTGKIPATSETFISPTQAYSEKFRGVLVKFNVKAGTKDQLKSVGVSDGSKLVKQQEGNLPKVTKGWADENKAYFKTETRKSDNQQQVNIGLGKGKALDIFNKNIESHEVIQN